MIDFSLVYVLAEDVRHQNFVRRYLLKAGLAYHEFKAEPIPKGSGGAGEQWVRKRYPHVVKKCRARSASAKTALIVIVDADVGEVSQRLRQLEGSLKEEGVASRQASETIAHFIPRRNIETWVLHLRGEGVNEQEDYKARARDDMIRPAAETFHLWTLQGHAGCLPSVSAAIHEAARLA